MTCTVADASPDLASMSVYDDRAKHPSTAADTAATPRLPRPSPGPSPPGSATAHTLSWSVPDKLGNTATRGCTVDDTSATLTINRAPRHGAKVKKTVTVTAGAVDRNAVERVELLINGKVVATDTSAGYTFTVRWKRSYGKTIRMRLRAYDNATHTRTRTWHRR